jgi:hypothetical protein
MRFTKAGLAALAAMVAMALIGVSQASANEETAVLCETPELECEKPFPNPTTLVGYAQNAKMLTSIGTVECASALGELTLLNELGKVGTGHALSASFSKCHLGSTSCTVTVIKLGLVTLEKSGALRVTAKSDGNSEANLKCGFLINCTYGGTGETEIVSNEAGELQTLGNEYEMTLSKGFCPETARVDETGTAVNPKTLEPIQGLWIES